MPGFVRVTKGAALREFLETTLNYGMKVTLALHDVLSAILTVGIVALLLSPWMSLRRFFIGLMIAVWTFSAAWWMLDAVETFAYDKSYGFFLLIFPGEYMGLPLLLSAIGLVLHRFRLRREVASQSL